MSASQFVCTTLGIPPLPPARAAPIAASDCWLCGGPLDDNAWPLKLAMKQSSVSPSDAKSPHSDAVCWQCMALKSNETWKRYVATLPPGHGKKQGKLIGWRNSSHLVANGMHLCPSRAEWRGLLLSPPEPPFVAVIAESTQLQIIGMADIAYDRSTYPVQIDLERVLLNVDTYAACLEAFERLYHMGFSKAAIVAGTTQPWAVHGLDIDDWEAAVNAFEPFRNMHPETVNIVRFVAQKEVSD